MKTTLEIPDELFKRTKATAAMRGESLKEFVTEALREHLDRQTARAPLRAVLPSSRLSDGPDCC